MLNDDPFRGLFENRPSRILSLIFSSVSIPIICWLFYGIIWYERFGTDNKRTLMNKLVAANCWSFIQTFLFCQTLETLTSMFGPFNEHVCFFLLVSKNALKTQFLLFFDSNIVVQYLFIFWIKNPAAVQDDFWSDFVSIWISGLTYIFNFSKFFIAHRLPMNYYACARIIPDIDWSLPSHFGAHFEVFTLLTIVIVKLKIHFFKAKSTEKEMTKRSLFRKTFTLDANNSHALANFSTNFISLIIFGLVIIVGLKLNRLTPTDLNIYPNYLLMYFFQLILPNLVGYAVLGLLYMKNSAMRATLVMEFNNFYSVF
jgi:hypothetical protein